MYETVSVSFQCIKGKAITLPFLCFVWLLFSKRKSKTCHYLSLLELVTSSCKKK